MTRVLRIVGWVLFAAGIVGFVAAGGPTGFGDNPVLGWVSLAVAMLGMFCTLGSALLANVQAHRKRANRLREIRESRDEDGNSSESE